jgi:predicted NAD/FAD-binding protein
MRESQRVAVIGSGIGGLTAAWLLRGRHQVTLFEQHSRPGMGVFGIDYSSGGRTTRIDVPTRVFCEGYYPHLFALLSTLGVQVHATDHAGAFADGSGEIFFHYGNFRLLDHSVSYLRRDGRRNPLRLLRIVRDSLRFFPAARRDLVRDPAGLSRMTFGAYLEARGYSDAFTRGVLLPTLSVICTCDYEGVRAYPADLILGYLASGVMKQGVMRAELGVDAIVGRLVEGVTPVCGAAVSRISRVAGGSFEVHTLDGATRPFDRVVMATQAHQAAQVLGDAFPQTALLRRIPFEHSVMRVHTDASVLPRAGKGGLSPVTYHLPQSAPRPEVTVDMTQAFSTYTGQTPVFQTWNPLRPVREGSVLIEVGFTRPRVTHDSREASAELRRLQAQESEAGLLFCGAYMADRVPLLEAAVESAVGVAERLGVPLPWSTTV